MVLCAFEECTSLESVSITGAALSSLPERMFKNCTALKSIEIPSSVTVIEAQAFLNCTSLESVVISENVTETGLRDEHRGECVSGFRAEDCLCQ